MDKKDQDAGRYIEKMVSDGRQLLQVERSQRIQHDQQHTESRPSENVVKLTPRR